MEWFINAVNKDRKSALHIAAQKNNAEIVELLLQQERLDTNAVDSSGRTAVELAQDSFETHYEVLKLLPMPVHSLILTHGCSATHSCFPLQCARPRAACHPSAALH